MDWEYQGYAATLGRLINCPEHGYIFVTGCFKGNVGKVVPLYCDHDSSERIGDAYLEAEDDVGLKFKANFYDTVRARELETKIREGILSHCSIDMCATEGLWNEDKSCVACTRVMVREVSVVLHGGNPDCWIGPIDKRKTLADLLTGLELEVKRARMNREGMDAAKRNGFYGLRGKR